MPRRLTPPEQAIAIQWFPHIDLQTVWVTGESTPQYNCIAWTLGIVETFVWPWGLRLASKAEFDMLYRNFGAWPAPFAPVSAFGFNWFAMTHGAISGIGHGPEWESKCGAWLRITHGLRQLEGGALYGDVLGFYSQPGFGAMADRRAELRARVSSLTESAKLSDDECQEVGRCASRVDPALRRQFRRIYDRWRRDWDSPGIRASSCPLARAYSIAFVELLALGPAILPLVMERIQNRDEFFALILVDQLLRPSLVVRRDPDDERLLTGEQGRALATVRRWVAAQ